MNIFFFLNPSPGVLAEVEDGLAGHLIPHCEGYLQKKNPSGLGSKRRFFRLFDHALSYWTSPESKQSLGSIDTSQIRQVYVAADSEASDKQVLNQF